ncbi:MAG: heme ABC exporter ATP-binding protein CcmA [Steroidobacteraceae bacterium]
MSALVVNNLSVYRGERAILCRISFELAVGRALVITGPNGAGKTTLLRTLCGLVEPEEGELFWRSERRSFRDAEYHADLAYLGHEAPLKMDLTGRENLRGLVGLRRDVRSEAVEVALGEMQASSFADRAVRTLSAGQRRRIAFAALSLMGATLWVLDEPVTNLDRAGEALVQSLLTRHLSSGGLLLAATHQPLGLDPSCCDSLLLAGATS